jgi:hypothetical protein
VTTRPEGKVRDLKARPERRSVLTTGLEALREEKSSGKGSPSKRKMLQRGKCFRKNSPERMD